MKTYEVLVEYTASAYFKHTIDAESEGDAIEQIEKHEYLAGCMDFNRAIGLPSETYEVDEINLKETP